MSNAKKSQGRVKRFFVKSSMLASTAAVIGASVVGCASSPAQEQTTTPTHSNVPRTHSNVPRTHSNVPNVADEATAGGEETEETTASEESSE